MPYKKTNRTYKKSTAKRYNMRRLYRGGVPRFRRAGVGRGAYAPHAFKPSRTTGQIIAKPGYGTVLSPFPQTLWTAFTYSQTFTLSQSVASDPAIYTFRANSLYDPDQTGTGGQPRYMDTLLGDNGSTAPYRNYRVHACKIEATLWPNTGETSTGNALVAIIPRRSNVNPPASVDEMRMRPYAKCCPVVPAFSYKPRYLSNFCKIKSLLGHKDLMDVDASASAYNANPSEEVYFDVCLCNVQSGSTANQCIQVTMTYFVQLYNLADVADF